VVVAADDAVALDEIQQVRYLLQIRRNIRIVGSQMHIVEDNVDNPLDLAARRIELAGGGGVLLMSAEQVRLHSR